MTLKLLSIPWWACHPAQPPLLSARTKTKVNNEAFCLHCVFISIIAMKILY